jgi:toxin-antitoxin system PIN domain toxin
LYDINVWLALELPAHVHHKLAKGWFQTRGERNCVLCRVTQMSLLRLLTNKAVMGIDVSSAEQAWDIVRRTREREDVEWREEPASLEADWETLSLFGSPKGSWWTDAYLAAFAIGHSIRLVTFDKGYRQFESYGLELLVLQPAPVNEEKSI